jgi:tRNA(fMet)-specific endonuclease VapC
MENKQYLLDTNILIEFMKGNSAVVEHILKAGTEHCCMSVVSLQELYFGAYKAREKKQEYYEKELMRIGMLRERFTVLQLPEEADGYGQIKMALRKKGNLVDEFDMLIGGQSLTAGLTVVRDNVKHFTPMPGVKVENWMERPE